jgi:hypothetical protein
MKISEKVQLLLLAHAMFVISLLAQVGWLNLCMFFLSHQAQFEATLYDQWTIAMSMSIVYIADWAMLFIIAAVDLILWLRPYLGRYTLRLNIIEHPKDEL